MNFDLINCSHFEYQSIVLSHSHRNMDRLNEFANRLEGPGVFVPVRCDVTKEEEILAMFEVAREKFGGIDVLINNAGVG